MKKLIVTVTLAACAAAASAYDVRFKNIYQSHMVLQTGKANEVAVRYGWARRPRLTLESAHALPLRPFSTDHGSTLDYGK